MYNTCIGAPGSHIHQAGPGNDVICKVRVFALFPTGTSQATSSHDLFLGVVDYSDSCDHRITNPPNQ